MSQKRPSQSPEVDQKKKVSRWIEKLPEPPVEQPSFYNMLVASQQDPLKVDKKGETSGKPLVQDVVKKAEGTGKELQVRRDTEEEIVARIKQYNGKSDDYQDKIKKSHNKLLSDIRNFESSIETAVEAREVDMKEKMVKEINHLTAGKKYYKQNYERLQKNGEKERKDFELERIEFLRVREELMKANDQQIKNSSELLAQKDAEVKSTKEENLELKKNVEHFQRALVMKHQSLKEKEDELAKEREFFKMERDSHQMEKDNLQNKIEESKTHLESEKKRHDKSRELLSQVQAQANKAKEKNLALEEEINKLKQANKEMRYNYSDFFEKTFQGFQELNSSSSFEDV